MVKLLFDSSLTGLAKERKLSGFSSAQGFVVGSEKEEHKDFGSKNPVCSAVLKATIEFIAFFRKIIICLPCLVYFKLSFVPI